MIEGLKLVHWGGLVILLGSLKKMNKQELEFKNIWDAFQPKIKRFLTGMVGSRESEDLTQEVFLRANQALGKFKGDSKISTWIYKIAANAAIDKLRSSPYQKDKQNTSISELVEEIADREMLSARKQCIRKEMNSCIRNFVENLPENYRIVIVLSELEGYKNKDIASILGINVETVKIRLHRAREKLRKELNTHCDFYRGDDNELACDLKKRACAKNI